ncbi:type II toxin-antitoxin system PemK/MazF family toxin [Lonepinella sp. MS14437]|uniref:type II toxin-antitoxin system PemK/MazF family toxin n=1 Tax=Lonepinella sp. MS14437 TaxID=3003620 RepID=UPI0036DE9B1B
MTIPKRGDIIHLQFDPATGREMQGKHYALVISGSSNPTYHSSHNIIFAYSFYD